MSRAQLAQSRAARLGKRPCRLLLSLTPALQVSTGPLRADRLHSVTHFTPQLTVLSLRLALLLQSK